MSKKKFLIACGCVLMFVWIAAILWNRVDIELMLADKNIKDIKCIVLNRNTRPQSSLKISGVDACREFKDLLSNSAPHGLRTCLRLWEFDVEMDFIDGSRWSNGAFVLNMQGIGIICNSFYGDEDEWEDYTAAPNTISQSILLQSILLWSFDRYFNQNVEISDKNYAAGIDLVKMTANSDYKGLEGMNCDGLWSGALAVNLSLVRKDYRATRLLLKHRIPFLRSASLFFDQETPDDIRTNIYIQSIRYDGPTYYNKANFNEMINEFKKFWLGEFDLGDFPANAQQTIQFTITNSRTYPLQILRVRSGCPCLEAVCDKKSLAPGESTVLRVNLKPHSIIGKFTKTIYVETDDPQQRFLRFELRGNAIPLLAITPEPIQYLGILAPDRVYDYRFTLVPTKPRKPIRLELATDCLPDGVTVRLQQGKEHWELQVKLDARQCSGLLNLQFAVKVKEPTGWPDIRFALSGKIQNSPTERPAPAKTPPSAPLPSPRRAGKASAGPAL